MNTLAVSALTSRIDQDREELTDDVRDEKEDVLLFLVSFPGLRNCTIQLGVPVRP